MDQHEFVRYIVTPPIMANARRGVYEMLKRGRRVVASSVLVSMMIPTVALGPDGSWGDGWFAVTVDLRRGQRVGLKNMFKSPSRVLGLLARATLQELRRRDCFQPHLVHRVPYQSAVLPKWVNFAMFSLTATGLAIGFHQGSVGPPGCGRVSVVIPYPVIRPVLTHEARSLVGGIRAPRHI